MKTYALLAMLCSFALCASNAKIKNGYSLDIQGARESLKTIKRLLNEDTNLSIFQRMAMHSKVETLTEFIVYYELTDNLLGQFQTISPDQYAEIDILTDRKRRSVDVYVKFVPEKETTPGVAGTTNLNQDKDDPDGYSSEYGIHTVSVRIRAEIKSLHLLAHELGHVKYQVPNLAAYMQFYTQYYLANTFKIKKVGHNDNDPSGRQAWAYSEIFRKNYAMYIKSGKKKM